MSLSIELGFDDESLAALRDLSETLRESFGGRAILKAPAEHHISLALLSETGDVDFEALLASVSGRAGFALRFAQASTFPSDEGVVYLPPEPCAELAAIHADVHRALERGEIASNGLYWPDHWVPHCTILIGVAADVREDAIAEVSRRAPETVHVTRIRGFHYGEDRLLYERRLR